LKSTQDLTRFLELNQNSLSTNIIVRLNESINSGSLHLRSLNINSDDLNLLMEFLKMKSSLLAVASFSLSYNTELGDFGIEKVMRNLPKTIRELGIVNCGITDIGAQIILDELINHPDLSLICMEQNELTDSMRITVNNRHVTIIA
jgi:hypothetical protein